MKNLRVPSRSSRHKKVVCTVSAAALMLGVSSAATVGLHFQENYCSAYAYSGYPVTLTAFGIAPSSWENLTPMDTGYNACSGPLGYTLSEVIDTTTSTNGLNPLPNGSLSVNWFGPTANYNPFAGYAGQPPYYAHPGGSATAMAVGTNPSSGEEQVYATFIRDGVNFGPGENSGDNDQPGYSVDITGLKSLFTNSSFVVEMMASGDSIETLTNVFVIDVPNSITNTVAYPNTPPVNNTENTSYYQGTGGGLSTGSAPFNTDHIQIMSAPPQHVAGEFNHAGTVSGFIITDKPVVSMEPHQTVSVIGDTITLNPYAIGVPPLSYQWRRDGAAIPEATNSSYTVSGVNMGNAGNYDLVVTNVYGSATSAVVGVGDLIMQSKSANVVFDSNPANAQHDGVNMGATWEASSSDGTTDRTGVMSFDAAESNGISVLDNPAFDGTNGTITFWMRSTGATTNASDSAAAALFLRSTGGSGNDFVIAQANGAPGNLMFQGPNASLDSFTSVKGVSDNKWHFVALTFSLSVFGGVDLYIDGALDSSEPNGGDWSWSVGQPLEIGYSSDSTFGDYNGLLDDVRYYDVILTPTQIASIDSSDALVDTNDLQLQFNFTSAPGNGLVLSWMASAAVLQSAPSVTGPWTDVTGATSPYTIVPGTTQQFFRYRYAHTPQTLVSNPYLM